MRLYFLRHASASKGTRHDAARKLTRGGRAEAVFAGMALQRLCCKPAIVLTSPLVRAEQTARLAAEQFRPNVGVKVVNQLKNGASLRSLLVLLRRMKSADEVVLVGHAPGLSEHVARLVGASGAEAIPLAKGGVACVELQDERSSGGHLRWLLRPKQVRLIAKS